MLLCTSMKCPSGSHLQASPIQGMKGASPGVDQVVCQCLLLHPVLSSSAHRSPLEIAAQCIALSSRSPTWSGEGIKGTCCAHYLLLSALKTTLETTHPGYTQSHQSSRFWLHAGAKLRSTDKVRKDRALPSHPSISHPHIPVSTQMKIARCKHQKRLNTIPDPFTHPPKLPPLPFAP